MEFQSQAQQTCYEKVSAWMKELFGEFAVLREESPLIGVMVGSALAQTAVFPWREDEAVVCTRAYVVTKIELTQDLLQYLLRENADMRFGAFGVDSDGDILFEHSIVGSSCDKNELKASVMAVVMTADQYDDDIVSRWGGQRALDQMRS
jgi:type III secretion system-like peptide-binding chaperone